MKKRNMLIGMLLALSVILGACAPASTAPQPGTPGAQVGGVVASCPDSELTGIVVRYQEGLASTITYGNPTAYAVPTNANERRTTLGTLHTNGNFSSNADVTCGTGWKVITVTSVDAYTSAESVEFSAVGATAKIDVMGKAIDSPKFKVEDKYSGGSTFFEIGGSTAYIDANGSSLTVADASGNSALTLATDGYIDTRIYMKTNETKKQFGEDGLKVFMLVDADGSEYDEPIVSRDGGQKLVDVKTSMASDDLRKYSGYEYAYDIGTIGDRESYVDFYMESAAGVNPSDDPIIEFCAEGRYNSVKAQDTINVGCWTDAATQVAVATINLPRLVLSVS